MSEANTEPDAFVKRQQQTAERLQALTTRLVSALSKGPMPNPQIEGPGIDLYLKTTAAWWQDMLTNPAKAMAQQTDFLENSMCAYSVAVSSAAGEETPAPQDDKRFAGEDWTGNLWFNYLARQYQVTSRAIRSAVEDLDGPPDTE